MFRAGAREEQRKGRERERGHIPRDEESGKVGSGGHQLVRSAPCHHTTHGLDSEDIFKLNINPV